MNWEKIWNNIKIFTYWITLVRPVYDIIVGAIKGIAKEIERIKNEQTGE
ncbi:MAG: hypothetical protein [Arizlama microvirus]|nr:MAG: hypothetical protein [Arizlama microvirus]